MHENLTFMLNFYFQNFKDKVVFYNSILTKSPSENR